MSKIRVYEYAVLYRGPKWWELHSEKDKMMEVTRVAPASEDRVKVLNMLDANWVWGGRGWKFVSQYGRTHYMRRKL